MRPPDVRNPAARRGSRAKQRTRTTRHFTRSQRSAQNWFLDAATYALDGDTASARAAGLRGCIALPEAPR